MTTREITHQNLIRDKVCLNDLNYTIDVCNDLHNKSNDFAEIKVQQMTNNIIMGNPIIYMLPSLVACIFLGSFSDIYGRKLPVLLSSLGILLEIIGVLICAHYLDSSATFLLLTSVPGGLFGGMMVEMTVLMSYLTETTTPENRAIRYALVEMAFLLSGPAGSAYGGYMFSSYGYRAVFISSIITLLLGMLWIFFRLHEPSKKPLVGFKDVLRNLFSLDNVRESIRSCTRKREGNTRLQIWLLILAMCDNMLCFMGVMSIAYMFVQRMYGWDTFHFSMVRTVIHLLHAVSIVISVPLLTKVFKVHDSVLIIIGCVGTATDLILKSFAYKEWIYYLGSVASLLAGLTSIGIRSRISKLVLQKEIGKVFSVLALCEGLVPIIGTAISVQLYNASVGFFPGLTYFCFSLLLVVPFVISIWIWKTCPEDDLLNLNEEEMSDKRVTAKAEC